MTVIGILGSQLLTTQEVPFWWNPVSYTRQRFLDALHQLGHQVIIIPVDKPETASTYISLVDKILLTGGPDISPHLYGETPHRTLESTNPYRDTFELAAIKAALAADKAIFGICRGLQLLNVYFGGTLYQDLSENTDAIKHRQAPTPQQFPTHSISVSADSLLSFLPETYRVNSFHHQAIKTLAPQLTSIATAPDGIVEAVENREHRILAVQWHPECTYSTEPHDLELFKYFAEKL